jgi:hypothetical protein
MIIEEPHPIGQDQPPPTKTLMTSHHRPGTTDQDAHDQPPPTKTLTTTHHASPTSQLTELALPARTLH